MQGSRPGGGICPGDSKTVHPELSARKVSASSLDLETWAVRSSVWLLSGVTWALDPAGVVTGCSHGPPRPPPGLRPGYRDQGWIQDQGRGTQGRPGLARSRGSWRTAMVVSGTLVDQVVWVMTGKPLRSMEQAHQPRPESPGPRYSPSDPTGDHGPRRDLEWDPDSAWHGRPGIWAPGLGPDSTTQPWPLAGSLAPGRMRFWIPDTWHWSKSLVVDTAPGVQVAWVQGNEGYALDQGTCLLISRCSFIGPALITPWTLDPGSRSW